jgi:formylglycine-generating enzyme required for sulfatase activity
VVALPVRREGDSLTAIRLPRLSRAPALLAATVLAAAACHGTEAPPVEEGQVAIPGGDYPVGSDSAERELGYALSPAAVREAGWYDMWESQPRAVALGPFAIDRTPVTQSEYAEFVAATGHRAPGIDAEAYQRQGFLVHPYSEVVPYIWAGQEPPADLADHPVVLISRDDAEAYCAWRGEREDRRLRLPTEGEWEASCRGPAGRTFPWGDRWSDGLAHIGANGTASVWAHPAGATPDGVLEMAGNVFEWTGSSMPDGRPLLKSCSWDDSAGSCRCGFRHGRPAASRHILIGFRCAGSR